jgi:hypothetical protein
MATHNHEEGTRPGPLNKAAWLEALFALELEFLNLRNWGSSPITGASASPPHRKAERLRNQRILRYRLGMCIGVAS